MKAKHSHITIGGEPLCTFGTAVERTGITCGHRSIAAATRAKRELQKRFANVRVVPGHCPTGRGFQ